MKRLKRYSEKIVIAFVLLFVCVLSTSFDSHASSNFDFVYNSAEPSCSEGQGYLVLLMHNGNDYSTRLYSFMSSSVNGSGAYMPTASNISITSNRVVFNINTNSGAVSAFHAVYYIAQSGNMSLVGATDSDTIDITPTGGQIVGWQVYGNGYVSSNTQNSSLYWSVSFRGGDAINQFAVDMFNALNELVISNGDNSSLIIDTLLDMKEYLNQVQSDVGVSTDYLLTISNYFYEILDWISIMSDQLYSLESYLQDICWSYLPDIYDQLDSIGKKIDKSNTWLEKIWNSIQEFFNPTDEEKETTDKFAEDSNAQSDKLNDLNDKNKVDKVDPDDASGSVDSFIDENSILNYGELIQIFTNHEYILKCILVVLAIGLVSYVLFGKKR